MSPEPLAELERRGTRVQHHPGDEPVTDVVTQPSRMTSDENEPSWSRIGIAQPFHRT